MFLFFMARHTSMPDFGWGKVIEAPRRHSDHDTIPGYPCVRVVSLVSLLRPPQHVRHDVLWWNDSINTSPQPGDKYIATARRVLPPGTM